MALGAFPDVPLEHRVYVDVDGKGGYIYLRYEGGREILLTDNEVAAIGTAWVCYYSGEALDQLRAGIASSSDPKEIP